MGAEKRSPYKRLHCPRHPLLRRFPCRVALTPLERTLPRCSVPADGSRLMSTVAPGLLLLKEALLPCLTASRCRMCGEKRSAPQPQCGRHESGPGRWTPQ